MTKEYAEMGSVATATPAPSTTGRLESAWKQAEATIRRASVAAVLTSCTMAVALSGPVAVRVAVALCGSLLAAAALVDVHERRLPNRLLLLAAGAALAGAMATGSVAVVASTVAGAAIACGSMLVVRVQRGVGMGDVKAAAAIGASAGSVALLAAPIAIAVGALVAATYGWLAHRRRIPLGPSLWIGWAVALFGISSGWWS